MDSPQHNGHGNGAAPISCAQIAAKLRRNPVSISRAIKRLGIQPAIETPGGFKFYSWASVKKIEQGMRRRNFRQALAA